MCSHYIIMREFQRVSERVINMCRGRKVEDGVDISFLNDVTDQIERCYVTLYIVSVASEMWVDTVDRRRPTHSDEAVVPAARYILQWMQWRHIVQLVKYNDIILWIGSNQIIYDMRGTTCLKVKTVINVGKIKFKMDMNTCMNPAPPVTRMLWIRESALYLGGFEVLLIMAGLAVLIQGLPLCWITTLAQLAVRILSVKAVFLILVTYLRKFPVPDENLDCVRLVCIR